MRAFPFALALAGLSFGLAGCDAPLPIHLRPTDTVTRLVADMPPGAAPDSCWGKQIEPGVYETVTEQVMLQPAEVLADGTLLSPAIYKTETRQAVLRQRRESWFETPCQDQMTADFIASLQRALAARGYYNGTVTGLMDKRTRKAVRLYQKPQGLDSGILTMAAARRLGLVAVVTTAD